MGKIGVDRRGVGDTKRAFVAQIRLEIQLAAVQLEIFRAKALVKRARLARAVERFGWDLQERAFNPDQPRVPAGSPRGGQWTSVLDGALGPNDDEDTESAGPDSIEVAADGHHFVPRALFEKLPLQPETRRVFEEAKTGRLSGGLHYFDGPHRIYNAAVAEHYRDFIGQRGLRSEDLTPSQARQFADSIRNSTDPRIRDFNLFIYRREVWYWIRRLRLRE